MKSPGGNVTVTTEVGYCPFCRRTRTLRNEVRHLGALVRTTIDCESCHRTLSSTIGAPPAAPDEAEAAPPVEQETPAPASPVEPPAAAPKPARARATGAKSSTAKPKPAAAAASASRAKSTATKKK